MSYPLYITGSHSLTSSSGLLGSCGGTFSITESTIRASYTGFLCLEVLITAWDAISVSSCEVSGSTLTAVSVIAGYAGLLPPILPCYSCGYFTKPNANTLNFIYAYPVTCLLTTPTCGTSPPVSACKEASLASEWLRHTDLVALLLAVLI
eukprot:3472359-Pleurochrysis_carterae.AAC.5